MTRSEWVALLALAAVQFTNILDFMIVMPLGPRYIEQFQITAQQFGNIVASYGFAAFFGGVIAAGFIDRFERKRAMLVLFACFTASTWLCFAAPNYGVLLLARALTGVFGGVMGSMVMSIVGDLFADARRGFAIGIITVSFSVASVIGVPLGLWIAEHFDSVGMPFLLLAAIGVVIWCVLAFALPILRRHLDHPRRGFINSLGTALGNRNHLLAYLFTTLLVFGTFTVVPFLATFCVKNVGLHNDELKYIYIVGGLCTFVTMPVIGRLADIHGKLLLFQIFGALAIIPTLIITNLPPVSLPIAVLATTFFMVATSGRMVPAQALITNASIPEFRAGFLSINSAVQHLASGFATSISATILTETDTHRMENYSWVGWIAVTSMLSSVFFARLLRAGDVSQGATSPQASPSPRFARPSQGEGDVTLPPGESAR